MGYRSCSAAWRSTPLVNEQVGPSDEYVVSDYPQNTSLLLLLKIVNGAILVRAARSKGGYSEVRAF